MFPEIRFSENLVFPTYVLSISFLYCFLLLVVAKRAALKKFSVTMALDLAFVMMITGFLGGRLTHVFYEEFAYYSQDWMRVFRFWEGGFVFYGGFLAAWAACWIYLRVKKLSFFEWSNFYAPILALGYGLGRISCFLAGCCFGRTCDLPWSVMNRHPVQLYAVIWELSVFAFLLRLEKKSGRPLFLIWLALHAIGRLVMEYFRDDFRGSQPLGLSISTWISLVLLAASLSLLSIYRTKIKD
jgi:phosphatidylglycerol---prolipoprotein diacylglyceryl transferase